MEVHCPACAARYNAADDKLHGKTVRMRCRACETVWLVSGPGADEQPAARVVRKNEHRDLFATREPDLGSVKETLRPPPPDALTGGMAARNESSVLFTVDALRGAGRVKTPEPEATPMSSGFRTDDDEGIIDLKALASSPPKGRVVAPLFSEPPPAAFAADVDSGRLSSPSVGFAGFRLGKRAIAGIAAAAVAVVLSSIGLAAAFRGEEPVARVAANSIVAPVALPPVAAPAAPSPVTPPPVVASTSSDDDDSKAMKKVKGAKGSKGVKASFVGTKVQSSGVAKKEPLMSKATPKAADKCGCKGDFTCVLRCTATGK